MQERKNLQGHSIQPLYVPLPQHTPRSGRKEKDFQLLTAQDRDLPPAKPPLGSRNIANYFTCIIGCLHADRRETLQPLPEPGFVCVRARKSEADRVPKAETRSAPVGSLNLAHLPTYLPLTTTACGMSEGPPSCVLPPVTVCYP
jgi:hypothetical protein